MTPASVETEIWPRRKWWAAIILAFGLQVGLVLWLGDRSPVITQSLGSAPSIFLTESAPTRLPTLTDPLLFSPANPHGFSGQVWTSNPKLEYEASEWTSPPVFLTLQTHRLTNEFSNFIKTNSTPAFAVVDSREPQLASPRLLLPGPVAAPPSRLLIEGELVGRVISAPPALPSWPHTDLLSNSVVQVVVDLDGNTVSANLLSSCGLKVPDKVPDKDPDKYALNVARSFRYQSIRSPGPEPSPIGALTWGKLIFEWQTVALSATNLPPQKP